VSACAPHRLHTCRHAVYVQSTCTSTLGKIGFHRRHNGALRTCPTSVDARFAESVPKDAEAVMDNLSTAVGGDDVLTCRETVPPTSD
jgi:hypothetical protein